MAMLNVQVSFRVKTKVGGGQVSTEVLTLIVDDNTFRASQSENKRKELSGWARQYFPTAIEVEVKSMKKI